MTMIVMMTGGRGRLKLRCAHSINMCMDIVNVMVNRIIMMMGGGGAEDEDEE